MPKTPKTLPTDFKYWDNLIVNIKLSFNVQRNKHEWITGINKQETEKFNMKKNQTELSEIKKKSKLETLNRRLDAEERTTKLEGRFLKNYPECIIGKTEDTKKWKRDLKLGKIE